MSSHSESEPPDYSARVDEAQRRALRSRQSKGGDRKNALYCTRCEAELDEPNGACEFCARADAVLEGDL